MEGVFMRRLLLISERVLFRQALARAITDEEPLITTQEAANVDEATRYLHSDPPDIILIHVGKPVSAAMQTFHEILVRKGTSRVMLLLDTLDHAVMTSAIQAGAAGCVDASVDVKGLLQALEEAANGEIALSDGFARGLARMLASKNSRKNRTRQPFLDAPTERELEVLKLVSLGLTNGDIARRLLVSESTIRSHVRTTIHKLGAVNRVHAVNVALALGMIDTGTTPD
jgi:DNA-binding NarL/FixJ family response regulator